jgi:hypothetical protein
MEIIRKFNVIKFVEDLIKRGVSEERIRKALQDWALEAHDKKIIIDEEGFHHIDGTGYLSYPYWEDKTFG